MGTTVEINNEKLSKQLAEEFIPPSKSELEDMTDADIFFNTLTEAGGPNVRRFDEDLDYNPANDMTFTKLKEKKGLVCVIKEYMV